MSKKLDTIEVRLPMDQVHRLKRIAELSGLSVETVIRVALATEALRHMPKDIQP